MTVTLLPETCNDLHCPPCPTWTYTRASTAATVRRRLATEATRSAWTTAEAFPVNPGEEEEAHRRLYGSRKTEIDGRLSAFQIDSRESNERTDDTEDAVWLPDPNSIWEHSWASHATPTDTTTKALTVNGLLSFNLSIDRLIAWRFLRWKRNRFRSSASPSPSKITVDAEIPMDTLCLLCRRVVSIWEWGRAGEGTKKRIVTNTQRRMLFFVYLLVLCLLNFNFVTHPLMIVLSHCSKCVTEWVIVNASCLILFPNLPLAWHKSGPERGESSEEYADNKLYFKDWPQRGEEGNRGEGRANE